MKSFTALLLLVGSVCAILALSEIGLRLSFRDKYALSKIQGYGQQARDIIIQKDSNDSDLIPHPYFGYVYSPSKKLSMIYKDAVVNNESNAEGFIDEEFPLNRNASVCVIGLFGGSAAMSWGMTERSHRINAILEKYLNEQLSNNTCSGYRVLNLGLGSHIAVQSLNVYTYYEKLLDASIFYAGFNECAHPEKVLNETPLMYPWINIATLLSVIHPNRDKIIAYKKDLSQLGDKIEQMGLLLNFYLIRAIISNQYTFKLGAILRMNKEMQDLVNTVSAKGIRSNDRPLIQLLNKYRVGNSAYHISRNSEFQRRVLRMTLPDIYTTPIKFAFFIARGHKKPFLNFVQPFERSMKGQPGWSRQRFPVATTFLDLCQGAIQEQTLELEKSGISSYSLSDLDELNHLDKNPIFDGVHLDRSGNEIAARFILSKIKTHWNLEKLRQPYR